MARCCPTIAGACTIARDTLDEPSAVVAGPVLGLHKRIRFLVIQHRQAELNHRLLHDTQALSPLLQEHYSPRGAVGPRLDSPFFNYSVFIEPRRRVDDGVSPNMVL